MDFKLILSPTTSTFNKTNGVELGISGLLHTSVVNVQIWKLKQHLSNSPKLRECNSFSSQEMRPWAQWKHNCFRTFCSLPDIDFAAVIHLFIYLFLCRVTMQMLCNGNQFSFVLDRDVVVIFIHKNLMHVFSYPASFLAIGSGESRETAWALSTGGRYVVEGKYRNTREAVRVSTCIIIKAHPVFICTAVACHFQLLLHC